MRIDAHQHFWRYNPVRDSWITDQMALLKKDYLPEQLAPALHATNMQGCIAVQTDQSEEETFFLLHLPRQYDIGRRNDIVWGVVGWVDLCADNVEERLQYLSPYRGLCGFRHIVQAEPDDRFMLRPAFLRGIGHLKEFSYTYDILVYARQLPAAIELVSKFPQQPFVIDHIAKPAIKERQFDSWARDLRTIAQGRNVYCKVSGMVTEADWEHWRPEDFKPYLDVVFEAFGADRLMFGSDWPVCLLAASYADVVQIVADYVRNFSQVDREKIFGLNAARFYGQRRTQHAIPT